MPGKMSFSLILRKYGIDCIDSPLMDINQYGIPFDKDSIL